MGAVYSRGAQVGFALLCLAAACLPFGCSRDIGPPQGTEGLEDLQPVTGRVSFDGNAPAGAVVLFIPAQGPASFSYRIAGVVEEDGSFEMQTTVPEGTRPGVAPGNYLVGISWTELVDPDNRDSDERDLLPEKYKDPRSSGLRTNVEEGTNELPAFVLTP